MDAVVRLLELERRLKSVKRAAEDLDTRLTRVENTSIQASLSGLLGALPNNQPQIATLSGSTRCCWPGPAQVTIQDAGTGAILAVGNSAADGGFSYATDISAPLALNLWADPIGTYASRMTRSPVVPVTLTPGDGSGATLTLGIADPSNYRCINWIMHPLGNTLNYTESVYGLAGTLTWDASYEGGAWTDCQLVNFPGYGACGATSFPIRFVVRAGSGGSGTFNVIAEYLSTTGLTNTCPLAGITCATLPAASANPNVLGAQYGFAGPTIVDEDPFELQVVAILGAGVNDLVFHGVESFLTLTEP